MEGAWNLRVQISQVEQYVSCTLQNPAFWETILHTFRELNAARIVKCNPPYLRLLVLKLSSSIEIETLSAQQSSRSTSLTWLSAFVRWKDRLHSFRMVTMEFSANTSSKICEDMTLQTRARIFSSHLKRFPLSTELLAISIGDITLWYWPLAISSNLKDFTTVSTRWIRTLIVYPLDPSSIGRIVREIKISGPLGVNFLGTQQISPPIPYQLPHRNWPQRDCKSTPLQLVGKVAHRRIEYTKQIDLHKASTWREVYKCYWYDQAYHAGITDTQSAPTRLLASASPLHLETHAIACGISVKLRGRPRELLKVCKRESLIDDRYEQSDCGIERDFGRLRYGFRFFASSFTLRSILLPSSTAME